jgi:hypothetical protein
MMTKTQFKKAKELVKRYSELKDMIEEHTSVFHDEIFYDIQGYNEDLNNLNLTSIYIENLQARVKATEMLYKSLVLFNDETETIYC